MKRIIVYTLKCLKSNRKVAEIERNSLRILEKKWENRNLLLRFFAWVYIQQLSKKITHASERIQEYIEAEKELSQNQYEKTIMILEKNAKNLTKGKWWWGFFPALMLYEICPEAKRNENVAYGLYDLIRELKSCCKC